MKNLVCLLCVVAVAGWVNRGQQQVIEYLVEENRVLREQLRGRRLGLTDAQRRRLAVHQGLGNELLTPLPANSNADGAIHCRERLGGILNYYYREAA